MSTGDTSGIWFSRMPNSPYGKMRAPGERTRVLIVDDHTLYRKGLRSMFDLEPDVDVVGEASDGSEAIEQVEALHPDIVLMDINMPGMDGMQATRKLADDHPGILIIILTMFKGEEHLREARRAGASAYVLKDAGSEVLLRTIRDVMSGETPLLQRDDSTITEALPGDAVAAGLASVVADPARRRYTTDPLITSNERAILRLLGEGLANEQICARTGLPEAMVRTYLAEIYRKLDLSGRDAAVQYARDHNWGEE
jgi:DNA-binding NarL/FixJ family response regulator